MAQINIVKTRQPSSIFDVFDKQFDFMLGEDYWAEPEQTLSEKTEFRTQQSYTRSETFDSLDDAVAFLKEEQGVKFGESLDTKTQVYVEVQTTGLPKETDPPKEKA